MERIAARGIERMRVLSWPRPYPENPYTWSLARALSERGITTITHKYLAALCAAPTDAQWLHLHWPEWMLRDASWMRAHLRAAWFFSLLDLVRARGVRIAWTAHNLVGHDDPQRALALRWRRLLLQRCSLVLGHFPSAEQDVRDLGFTGRFVWAPHPHVADEYPVAWDRVEAREALGWRNDEVVFLAFGAMEPYKGLDALAASFLRGARPGMRLHLAGAPSSKVLETLQRIVGSDERVTIEPRRVDRQGTARLCSAADVMVFGYREFYTSGVAMLALSYGLPVLGPARNHLRALEGKSFFRALASADAFAEVLEQWEPFASSSREDALRFAAECTWERMAETLDRGFAGEER